MQLERRIAAGKVLNLGMGRIGVGHPIRVGTVDDKLVVGVGVLARIGRNPSAAVRLIVGRILGIGDLAQIHGRQQIANNAADLLTEISR